MCGIAGIYSRRKLPLTPDHVQSAQNLSAKIAHRGPDWRVVRQFGDFFIAAQSQLAIQDSQNQKARLPLESQCGRYLLLFSGEIYNHLSLRKLVPNYMFSSKSDAETLLALLISKGEVILNEADGMWAFAFYDRVLNKVTLSRDRFGQKPLFWFEHNDHTYFCSELNALLTTYPARISFSNEVIGEILAHRFSIGAQTHIDNICKVPPGTTIIFTDDFRAVKKLALSQLVTNFGSSYEALVDSIRASLCESCKLLADVEEPVGIFLSSGLDSTAVAAMVAQEREIIAYSFSFLPPSSVREGNSFIDEYIAAKKFCNDVGIRQERVVISQDVYYRELYDWIREVGEPPCFQNDGVSLRMLARRACQDTRIILTGAGADELFDGYQSDCGQVFGHYFDSLQDCTVENFAMAYSTAWTRLSNFEVSQFWKDDSVYSRLSEKIAKAIESHVGRDAKPSYMSMITMLLTRLDGFELAQTDRACMRFGIENRSPFLSSQVVAAALSATSEWHYKTGNKSLLKAALLDVVPSETIDRPKYGFPIPDGYFLGPQFEKFIEPVLEKGSVLEQTGLLNLDFIRKLQKQDMKSARALLHRLAFLERLLSCQKSLSVQ